MILMLENCSEIGYKHAWIFAQEFIHSLRKPGKTNFKAQFSLLRSFHITNGRWVGHQ